MRKVKVSFRVKFAGHSDPYPPAALSDFKQIKPVGGDFVAGVLGVAGIKQPAEMKTFASLGVLADHWCVPVDAHDGTAAVEAEADSPSGHQVLGSSTIQVESFATGSKKSFKDGDEFGTFLQEYYGRPNAARLVPSLQFVVEEQSHHARPGQVEIFTAFLTAVLRSDRPAAQDFQTRIATQPALTRALGLLALRAAGYDVSSELNAMSAADRSKFLTLPPLQDPFDLSPTQALFQHLDMLWATFGATGQFEPVSTVASTLKWGSDYQEFQKLRKDPNHPSSLTPSIVRGVVYTAAGWSLGSFQRNDPLVADYIDFMLASNDTPLLVKAELSALSTNPAFKRTGGQ